MNNTTDNNAHGVPLHRFFLAIVLAPLMALYCFAAYCVGLLPLVVALTHWDDAQYRGKNDHNEAAVTMAIIAFMIWPWRRWRRLLEIQNAQVEARSPEKRS